MERTYITDAKGNELALPLADERNPHAAFHFAQTGFVQDGIVWRCSEIHGRHLRHRLTFTSYYNDRAAKFWSMGRLLHNEMNQQEKVARWEAELAAQQLAIA